MDFGRQADGGLRIQFSDSGVGMDEEARQKLFEPFFSGFESGRGLGMAVVRRVVDDYQGQINVDSGPGQGTKVVIALPAGGASSSKAQTG